MNYLKSFLEAICVKYHIFNNTESRDRKLILAMAFMVYVSALLAGYAMYVNVYFLLRSVFIAFLIGLCTLAFLILHDQSLLGTDKKRQVYTKILISMLLAASFTLTNNADKDYEALSTELVQNANRENSYKISEMNSKIEKINQEEMAIMRRIEEAGERINETKQPLIDARRSLKAFKANKDDRVSMIRSSYKDKFVKAQISDLNILILQAKKFASGGEGTLIAMILAFLFFIIESLPAILRLMLDSGDYMTRYLSSLFVVRDLRDQRIVQQRDFASADSDIISSLLHLEIIDKKSELINNGFQDTEEMIILDQRYKLLHIKKINPYTGQPLDYIDPNFFTQETESANSTAEKEESTSKESYKQNHKYEQEPVFDI